jgi:serine/threonine-protein kinase RsbT
MAIASLVPVVRHADVGRARRAARQLAHDLDFGAADAETVVLAVTELATNLVYYAVDGTITLTPIEGPRGAGIQVESRDRGPGIVNLGDALRDGASTGGGLGGGLPGVRRLMDSFDIATGPQGTRVVAEKWSAIG